MLIRSRAPLRISLAGGGTDVSPYSDLYGGVILNATISMYAYAILEIDGNNVHNLNNGFHRLNKVDEIKNPIKLEFYAIDRDEAFSCVLNELSSLPLNGKLDLHKGVFNRILKDHPEILSIALNSTTSIKLITYVDTPAGSGLGTSSTLVVAILGALANWLNLPFGEYDIAHLAYEIERKDLIMAGGKQDQYAATFGGFNFMEFYNDDKVIVNPLRIKQDYINELEFNLLLYHTGTNRLSSRIIEAQAKNIVQKKEKYLKAMHKLKEQAVMMKEAVLKSKVEEIGEILDFGWQYKKQLAEGITNHTIDEIYETAIRAGSTGGKISGAGGGGFIAFYCPKNTRYKVISALQKFGGEFRRFQFVKNGLISWRI